MMMAETEEMEMTYQNIFRRYEIKYILTASQRLDLESEMKGKMGIDKYGRTTIRNIYFDTDDNRLIRTSLDKPEYKEKLRVRSYSRVSEDDDVFVELKKKYESVVYKRRIALPEFEAMDWLAAGGDRPLDTQICKEIDYVRTFYRDLAPKVFLSYEREAYYPVDGSDIRITMDSNILGRSHDLSLRSGVYGKNVIGRDLTVLEVKVTDAMPLWLIRFLNGNGIHKTSFSKYGMYYMEQVMDKEITGGLLYA